MKKRVCFLLAVMMILLLTACKSSGVAEVDIYDAVTNEIVGLSMDIDLVSNSEIIKTGDRQAVVIKTDKAPEEIYEEIRTRNPSKELSISFKNGDEILVKISNQEYNSRCPFFLISKLSDRDGSDMILITSETYEAYNEHFPVEMPEDTLKDWLIYLYSVDYDPEHIYYPIHLTEHSFEYRDDTLYGNSVNPFMEYIILSEGVTFEDFYNYYRSIPRYSTEIDTGEYLDDGFTVTDAEKHFSFQISYDVSDNNVIYSAFGEE